MLRETTSREEARELASAAALDGIPLVVAAGGDGTVNTVIHGLYESGGAATLGILPLGTGNDLCRTLNIPLDPLEAFDLLARGAPAPRAIDLVRADSEERSFVFANMSSGGNSRRVRSCLTDEMKRSWGGWAYLRGALEVLTDLTGFRVSVKLDDAEAKTLDLWNVVVANGNTVAGGVNVAPQADISDGLLDVILVQDGTPLDVAALTTKLLLSNYLEDERIIFRRAARVEFCSEPPMEFVADGETIGNTPATFTVLPRALKVIAGPAVSRDAR